MPHASLINRGEQFVVTDGDTRFEGQCVWSWAELPGASPRRVYPLWILVRSIQKAGTTRMRPVPQGERLRVAQLAKALLETQETGCEVLLADE